MTTQSMLEGFAQYFEPPLPPEHCIVGMPLGTRCKRIQRIDGRWRVWIATDDYVYGTWLELYDDGLVVSVTVRRDEGDEVFVVRPSDYQIRRTMK